MWKSIRESFMPVPISFLISTSNLSKKATMPDTGASKLKKTVEKKKHPRVVNVLKDSMSDTNITKCILNLGVNFIVGE